MQKFSPLLWFDDQAEDAASFCVVKMTKIDIAALRAAYDGS